MRVLLESGVDDTGNGVAKDFVLSEEIKVAVNDLLDGVGYAVGLADLDVAGVFVDGGVVPIEVEVFERENEIGDDAGMSLRAEIEVAGIKPAADIEAGNVLAGSKGRVGRGTLGVAVEVAVVRREPGVRRRDGKGRARC